MKKITEMTRAELVAEIESRMTNSMWTENGGKVKQIRLQPLKLILEILSQNDRRG